MRVDHDRMSLWFRTTDAPAPEGAVAESSSVSATIAIHPPDASNRVEVLYRINGGPQQSLHAGWFRTDQARKVQYFRAQFPPLRPGDKVEYSAVCRCAGRQIPSAAEVAQLSSSFRVGELPSAGAEEGSSPLSIKVPLRTGGVPPGTILGHIGARHAARSAVDEAGQAREVAAVAAERVAGLRAARARLARTSHPTDPPGPDQLARVDADISAAETEQARAAVDPSTTMMPPSVAAANLEFPARRASLLRAWGLNFRHRAKGTLPLWKDKSKVALRHIAAGMTVFAEPDTTDTFDVNDWALFSGLDPTVNQAKSKHQDEFVKMVEDYLADKVYVYEDMGSTGPNKDGGEYDFVLRDVIALIYTFVGQPKLLTNKMIRTLIIHNCPDGQVPFACPDEQVPFAGQDLDRWIGEGPRGRHYFRDSELVLGVRIYYKLAMPETENHLLCIYTWRYLVNEYLEYVASLPPMHDRADPVLAALAQADPKRYINGPQIRDWVMQLLGRIVHSGTFESNAKPYESITLLAVMAFYQAADRLFPDDPERLKVKAAACNALDYLAAEFAFQSLEGKRMAPSRRNQDEAKNIGFYASDYLPNMFGILTGAYVYSDHNGEPYSGEPDSSEETWRLPYHWSGIDQNGGFALWALLSEYRVPHSIHDFLLNKHGGYFARIQTRYTTDSYPMQITFTPEVLPPNPDIQRPRYFQAVSSGEVAPGDYDVSGPASAEWEPVMQLYFATKDFLNTAGGQQLEPYYHEFEDVPDWLARAVGGEKVHNYDVLTRPTSLILRGDLQVQDRNDVAALEALIPLMRGQDAYMSSNNLMIWKNLALGYTFSPDDDDRHLDWPQRHPSEWDSFIVEGFTIFRADFHIFDFTGGLALDHPLAGHYLVMAKFSKNEDKDQFRRYGRGLWEVVPGHKFGTASQLGEHIRKTNPFDHFDNNSDHEYTWVMPTTGERLVIFNRFGKETDILGIVEIRAADGTTIPLNDYLFDPYHLEQIRDFPLLQVWQVDRDYGFTGRSYAHADGRGRVVIHNPFVGETLRLDSSDYWQPTRSRDTTRASTQLPAPPGASGNTTNIIGVARSGNVVYAAHYAEADAGEPAQPGELVALDAETLAVLGRVAVGKQPRAVGAHHASKRVYVMNRADVSVSVIDGNSHTTAGTVMFQGFALVELAVSQRYHRVYVTQPQQKRMLVINGHTLTEMPPITGLELNGDVIIEDAIDRLYTLVSNAQNPYRLDLVEFALTSTGQFEARRTTVDGNVSKHAKMALDAKHIYVINNGRTGPNAGTGQQLTVLDRTTLAIVGNVPLPGGSAHAVGASASQHVAYVVMAGDVKVIDTRMLKIIHVFPIAPNAHAGVAVDEPTGRAWYGASHSSTLYGSTT